MADLQELFARLKAQSSDTQSPSQAQTGALPSIWAIPQQQTASHDESNKSSYQPPAASSPVFTPHSQTPNPIHSTSILHPASPSPGVPAQGPTEQARTNNLLSLLKFNSTTVAPTQGALAGLQNVSVQRSPSLHLPNESRSLSAQDLVASMQRKPSNTIISQSPLATPSASDPAKAAVPSSSAHQQDFLLNLLKKPNNGTQRMQSLATAPSVTRIDTSTASMAALDVDMAAKPEIAAPPSKVNKTALDATTQSALKDADVEVPIETPRPTRAEMFSYINPFDQLHTSSPLNSLPKSQAVIKDTQAPVMPKRNRDDPTKLVHTAIVPDGSPMTAPTAAPLASEMVPDSNGKSVSQVLENVGDEVSQQMEEALAKAVALSDAIPLTTRENGKEEDIESNWESAEDSATEKKEEYKVVVHNFPMRPFVSIQIKNNSAKDTTPIRQDNFMVIAALKKEFDQVDRTLATASQTHIVYAQLATKKDNKGFRIIRQDTGDHKSIFRSAGERVFNVQICSPPTTENDDESVLGTGTAGSVFWTSVSKTQANLFSEEDLEARSFVMPPVPTPEESTSGSPVKTRAKLSNRHTEIFALARGKHIHLVAPAVAGKSPYCDVTTHKVDSKQYFAEHGFCINTTKASKDFCFSEDDTLIATLDKSGRVKFWDVRQMIERVTDRSSTVRNAVELREPLLQTVAAASGTKVDEKPSVSSIMLLDKERPHAKGVALRYMLIGFKQNHILQLWDLGLGKAVQEIRLPHEKDSDGICSISYHPRTGILAVGHPTRNSIYFLHLSAPKYNVPFMDQARYVEMLARGDPALPRPESTAIMSGLRELSFAHVGQLRSVDMLRTPVEVASDNGVEHETLFELYVLHSKGLVGIGIKRADLGWNAESRMQHPVDAIEAGMIEVNDLKIAPVKEASTIDVTSQADVNPKKPVEKKEAKKTDTTKAAGKVERADVMKKDAAPETPPKNTSKALDQAVVKVAEKAVPTPVNPPLMTPESYSMVAQQSKSPLREKTGSVAAQQTESRSEATQTSSDVLAAPERHLTNQQIEIKPYFDSLYHRLEADKRVSEAAAGAKQDAILRLVSSTLTENVEQTLHRIVSESIQNQVVPTLASNISQLIESKLHELVPQQINNAITREMGAILPLAVQGAYQDTQLHQAISSGTMEMLAGKLQQLNAATQQSMTSAHGLLVQRIVAEVEKRAETQLREADVRHQQDTARIEELNGLVRSMSSTLQRLSEGFTALQEQLVNLRQQEMHETALELPATDLPAQPAGKAAVSIEEQEIADITSELVAGAYEVATVQWLKSPRQAQLFDQLFIRVNPQYLQQVSPLVALSVAAAVTAPLDNNVDQRLDWLAAVLTRGDLLHEEVRDVTPQILRVLSERLHSAYLIISEDRSQNDLTLRKIGSLVRQVNEIRRITG